jgi:perosamine synthetase
MKKFIPVNEPLLDGNELKYVSDCINSGWISSEGPFVNRFENEFANYIGKKYAVAVSNGTAAIDISIESLNLKPGDEVILPAFTIISCVNQILRAGAKPIFIDSDLETWNIVVEQISNSISNKTKAIMVVHIYGLPVNLDPIISICKKHNLVLIEDTAEVIGQTYKGKMCGSFGDISTFSFYPNKHITTGEGGMILTDSEEVYNKLKKLKNLYFSENPDERFIHQELGWNCRMTNIQAAIGVAQLETIDTKLQKKRLIGKWYNDRLKNINGVHLPIAKTDYADNIYWVYAILLDEKYGEAKKIRKSLELQGIGTRPFFYPLNRQPIVNKYGFADENCKNAFMMYKQGLYLPSGLNLSIDQVNDVCDNLIITLKEIILL